MNTEPQAYRLWTLVFINAAVFLIFAFSFAKPPTRRDWRSFGAFSAIIDPATGLPADEGELVVTPLVRKVMPLLHYRSGDLWHVEVTAIAGYLLAALSAAAAPMI